MTQWVLALISTAIATCATLANLAITFLQWKNNKSLERYRQIIQLQINRLTELSKLLPNLRDATTLSYNRSLSDAINEHNKEAIASFANAIEITFRISESFFEDHRQILTSSRQVLLERNLKDIDPVVPEFRDETSRTDLKAEESLDATRSSLYPMKYAFIQQLVTEVYAELEDIGESLSSVHDSNSGFQWRHAAVGRAGRGDG